jgi:ribosomal protein L11 methylase PrmA
VTALRADGEIVLSGLLESQPEAIAGRLGEAGLVVLSVRRDAGWAAVRAAHG